MDKPVNIPAPLTMNCYRVTPVHDRNVALDMPRQGRTSAEKNPMARFVGVRTVNRHRSPRRVSSGDRENPR